MPNYRGWKEKNSKSLDKQEVYKILQEEKKKTSCVWRNVINIHSSMDIVSVIDELQRVFTQLNSFEIDPDDQNKLLTPYDSYHLRLVIDRALAWLVTKIYEAKLEPIIITLNSSDKNTGIL